MPQDAIGRLPTRRYLEYQAGQTCSVPACTANAGYEVYLYDYYRAGFEREAEEFFEQDYTCPFICGPHMEENETRADGRREPRGFVLYPFTNRHRAQGYSKYGPVAEIFEVLTESRVIRPELIQVYSEVNEELLAYLAANPKALHELTPRRFEHVVAAIFSGRGFDVQVTPPTRDGGVDLVAAHHDEFGQSVYLVECKRYASSRRVGVETVRGLYGVVEAERATKGLLVTTSSFTSVALDYASPLQFRLSLHDFEDLKEWLERFRRGAA